MKTVQFDDSKHGAGIYSMTFKPALGEAVHVPIFEVDQPAAAPGAAVPTGSERYRVEKSTGGFWPNCVRAGDGTRELFKGHLKQCQIVAAELACAFEDGKFLAAPPAPGAAMPIATLHDDGRFTWIKPEFAPHKSNYAGWMMQVYAAPPATSSPAVPTFEQIAKVLDGIDSDDNTDDRGWWDTSTGAKFGADRLREIRALFEQSPATPSPAVPDDESIRRAAEIAWPDLPKHWWTDDRKSVWVSVKKFAHELFASSPATPETVQADAAEKLTEIQNDMKEAILDDLRREAEAISHLGGVVYNKDVRALLSAPAPSETAAIAPIQIDFDRMEYAYKLLPQMAQKQVSIYLLSELRKALNLTFIPTPDSETARADVPVARIVLPVITDEMWEVLNETELMTWDRDSDRPIWTQTAVDAAACFVIRGLANEQPAAAAVGVPDGQLPIQPLVIDKHGFLRFQENPIVSYLANGRLNELGVWCAENDIDNKYQEQLAQLIGYSLAGFGELSYVSDETYSRAEALTAPTYPQEG